VTLDGADIAGVRVVVCPDVFYPQLDFVAEADLREDLIDADRRGLKRI